MRHLSHPHVVLNFAGTEQRAAAAVLMRRGFRIVFGQVPADVPVAIQTPGSAIQRWRWSASLTGQSTS
jgi:hypothetical protein